MHASRSVVKKEKEKGKRIPVPREPKKSMPKPSQAKMKMKMKMKMKIKKKCAEDLTQYKKRGRGLKIYTRRRRIIRKEEKIKKSARPALTIVQSRYRTNLVPKFPRIFLFLPQTPLLPKCLESKGLILGMGMSLLVETYHLLPQKR
jgi:hypothetical protein